MSSSMNDPKADERLTDDERFRHSETTSIKPLHAILRCLAEFGDSPVSTTGIVRAFFDAKSTRIFEGDQLNDALAEGIRDGYIELIGGMGYRLTEAGRSEVGPMLEMELRYV